MTNNEKLGVQIATQLKWEGDDIIETFFEALTDANYHTLRKKLEKVIEEDAKEADLLALEAARQVAI